MLAIRFKEKEAVNIFYSQVLMTKQGPLFKIWLAAHCQKKLTKIQILECDLETATRQIISSKVKIALRTSGHLLLGAVRILNRKAKYLFTDCKKVFTQMQKLLEPEIVDLPKEKLEADYDSITLREEFHDFESHYTDDTTLQEFFSRHQSRPEEITLREEYSYNVPVEVIHSGEGSEVSRKQSLTQDKTLMTTSTPSVDHSTKNFFEGIDLFFDSPDGFGDGGVAEAMIDNILRNVDGGLVNDVYLTTDSPYLRTFPKRTKELLDPDNEIESKNEKKDAKLDSSGDEGCKTIQLSSSSEQENADDESLSKSEKKVAIIRLSDNKECTAQVHSVSEPHNAEDTSVSKSGKKDGTAFSSEDTGFSLHLSDDSEPDNAEDTSASKSGKEDETAFSSEDTRFSLLLSDDSEPDNENTSLLRHEKMYETAFSSEDAGFTLRLSGVSEPENPDNAALSKSGKEDEIEYFHEDEGFTLHLSGVSEPDNPDEVSLPNNEKLDEKLLTKGKRITVDPYKFPVDSDDPDDICLPKNVKVKRNLLFTEEEECTLEPPNVSVTRRKRKIKRKTLIIDEVKKLSRKDMYEQFYYPDRTPRAIAAPPSRQFLELKEKSKPRVLLSTPAQSLGHSTLRKLFEKSLVTTILIRPQSELTPSSSTVEDYGFQSIYETSMMDVSNAQEELYQPQTENDMTSENQPQTKIDVTFELPEIYDEEESAMEVSYPISENYSAQENFPDEVEPMDIDQLTTAEKVDRTPHGLLSTLQESNKKGKETFSLMELCKNSKRKQAAATFYSLLLLKKQQAIEVSQSAPYEDIIISLGPKFHDM
ncbi:double-strand-break repair protein rad21-like protein 1 isoform 2-T2 [Thomomys bottae]